MATISPKQILTEFLRCNITDPRARNSNSTTEEFDGGSTDFTLSPSSGKLSCVNSVTVDGITQTKWKHYRIDVQNQKVIFYSNTASGTNNVDITYQYGTTDWIYPDKALVSLSALSFPRMNILVVAGVGNRVGQFDSDIESATHFQIDIWAKEKQLFTIDSIKYSGDKLAEYLGLQTTKAFRASVEDLHPALYDYTLLGVPRDMGFDAELQCHHIIVEVELKGINVGESL